MGESLGKMKREVMLHKWKKIAATLILDGDAILIKTKMWVAC